MNSPPRRRTGWKIIAGAVLGVVLLLAAAFLWIDRVGARRFDQMRVRVVALHEETLARNTPRPVLRGEPQAGNPWAEYQLAYDALNTFKGDHNRINGYVERNAALDHDPVAASIRAHPDVFDHLRRGAQRTTGTFPGRWEDGVEMPVPPLYQSQVLANMAACRARFLVEEGKHREAAELLLDAAQFGSDLRRNQVLIADMIGLAINLIALSELRNLVQGKGLHVADFVEIDRELEILNRNYPAITGTLKNEALSLGFELLRGEGLRRYSEYKSNRWETWRYAFSNRIMEAEAFERMLADMTEASEVAGKPWSEAFDIYGTIQNRVSEEKNPIVRCFEAGMIGTNRDYRRAVAVLRLLRTAAHYRATGEILELEDPFGTRFLHSEKGGRLKIWSVGENGVDDGGDNGGWLKWTRPPVNSGITVKDIVLDVPR